MTDFEIIELVKNGDRNAYTLLVAQYQHYVFTLAFRMLDSREDAEEVAQDCFVQAFLKLHTFRGQGKFSTWLYTIVRRKCLNLLRKKYPVFRQLEYGLEIKADEERTIIEKKERSRAISGALSELAPDDRALLTLYYEHDQTVAEISNIMNEQAGNIKVRLYRARKKLRTIIESKYQFLKD